MDLVRLGLVLLTVASAAIAILVIGHSPLFVAFAAICVCLSIVPLLRPSSRRHLLYRSPSNNPSRHRR